MYRIIRLSIGVSPFKNLKNIIVFADIYYGGERFRSKYDV